MHTVFPKNSREELDQMGFPRRFSMDQWKFLCIHFYEYCTCTRTSPLLVVGASEVRFSRREPCLLALCCGSAIHIYEWRVRRSNATKIHFFSLSLCFSLSCFVMMELLQSRCGCTCSSGDYYSISPRTSLTRALVVTGVNAALWLQAASTHSWGCGSSFEYTCNLSFDVDEAEAESARVCSSGKCPVWLPPPAASVATLAAPAAVARRSTRSVHSTRWGACAFGCALLQLPLLDCRVPHIHSTRPRRSNVRVMLMNDEWRWCDVAHRLVERVWPHCSLLAASSSCTHAPLPLFLPLPRQ